ncbi:hypothetical protein O181_105212 [Austropuccinia psidii MF-1]|uniref:Uncharacterized protein n=1 Tax=Austropuccinia psidii MF-1 TaxID=1389203 RepID=A0A9Q3JN46_9BASI|nr:hypothetical protein [Austropuccinia psidii MF-1]
MSYLTQTIQQQSGTSSNLCYSIILCPPTSAGQVFSITVPLENLLINKDISNSFSKSLAIQTMPYGFTLALPPSFQYHRDSDCIELLIIASIQDSSTKRLCACTKAERQAGRPTQLIAYAVNNTGTQSSKELWPHRELTAALDLGLTTGYFQINCLDCKTKHTMLKDLDDNCTHFLGLDASNQDGKLKTSVETIKIQTLINLKGFEDHASANPNEYSTFQKPNLFVHIS